MIKNFGIGSLLIAALSGSAWAQSPPPPGRVYAFDSSAQGGCPALDWHIVTGPNGALGGMIGWDDMQSMAKVVGTVNAGKVQMTATEVGGQGRTATVNGTVNPDGWFVVNISGAVNCQNIAIKWFVPQQGGGG